MNIFMIPALLLGPGLIIVSLFAKRKVVRVLTTVTGVALLIWLTQMIATIPMAYEREHRTVENLCHRQIITAIDGMLAAGQTDKARALTGRYLRQTKDSSFMRTPLHEIVQSLESERAESPPGIAH